MDIEKRTIKLRIDDGKYIPGDLYLFESSPNDEDMVLIKVVINGHESSYENENYFSALQMLRKELEGRNTQILCNGAAKNVYPSPMQLDMGDGRKAYKLYMGQQAKISDVVDIFDCDEDLSFVFIDVQREYYAKWLKS